MNISIDLAPNQIKFLESLLQRGDYRSRNEVVRDIIRRAEFEWAWEKNVEDAERLGVSPDIKKDRAAAFPKLRKRFRHAV